MKIRITAIALFCLLGLFQSCSKNDEKDSSFMDHGIITGYDMRACICCGGLMINFNGDTATYKDPYYLITNSSQQLGITDTTSFPIRMQVDWVPDTTICDGVDHIKITRFKRE